MAVATPDGTGWEVTDNRPGVDGVDTVVGMESFQFSDQTVDNAGMAALANSAPTGVSITGGTVAEGAAAGTVVGTASAVDVDAGDTHTYVLKDDAGGRFAIDSATGVITVAPGADLDHEASGTHSIVVVATDSFGEHVDETLTITITDVNETPDSIGFTGGTVAENSAPGTSVATASVTDPDAVDTHTYTLEDDAGGRFVIDGVTGEITVAPGADLDHEAADSHTVTIRATDAGGLHIDESLTITVADVNETPDSMGFVGGSVAENSAPGTAVATASVTDPDAGDTHTYTLEDDAGGRFVIDGATGEITVAPGADLDHEAAGSHTVTVRATDAGGLHIDETLTITVTDVNETPDSIGFAGGTVAENSAPGTSVATASVSDPDAGDSHTYTLEDDAGGRFVIDGVTGEITVAPGADLDHEAAGSHTVTVRATDGGGLHVDETLTITVSDVNETPDSIGFVGGTVDENAAPGTSVATASVTDPDAGDTHTYTLQDDAGGRFVIDGVTGEITVAPGADLDHEAAGSHTVTVRATDAGGLHFEDTLTITVSDVNETPDSIGFVGGTVVENAAAGTSVATASVSDPDAGDTHTYTLQDDAGGRFVIDGVTGEITVAPGADLDHEASGSHTVTVRATDAGGLHVDETLTITVSDVNETPDSIGFVGGTVIENASAGTSVATASVVDPDAGDTHTYTLQDDAGGRFIIDGVTGEITVAPGADLDHEAADSHTVTVRATDAGGLHVDETLTITVDDVNETPDSIGFVGGTVTENAAAGTSVATASVTDPDTGDTHTYTLQDDAGGRFVIDGVTGEITVAPGADLDHEASGSHTVTVRATDAGGLHFDETLTITVSDVNETPDSIGFVGGTVVENAAAGTSVANASVTDPDAGDTHTYSLQDDAGGRFVIDGVTGEITVAPGADLDHEAASSHTVTVRATDAGGLHVDETLTITVSDVNETPDSIGFTGDTVVENAPAGTAVSTAAVTDPDAGDTHTYTLQDDAGGRFVIDGVTGEITVAPGADLDHEASGTHTVTVRATDAGGLHVDGPLTITVSDINETPDSIGFVGGAVAENAAAGTSVATASVADPDVGDSHTYTLQDDAGGRFVIDGVTGEITVAPGADLDHEAAGSHNVTVRATDAGGLHFDESLTITVSDVNETPNSIGFIGGTVTENAAPGTAVATASVTDPDAADTHTYTLEDDAGGRFVIDGVTGEITVAPGADLDHEAAGSHTVTVRATDAGGLHVDETLTITVNDANETPDSIGFAGGTVVENAAPGTSVATAAVTDPDAGDTHTYTLQDDAGGRFVIDGVTGEITVAPGADLDHEAAGSHTVTVRATDAGGLHVDETLTITVSDTNETPDSIGFVGGTVAENATAGTSVATASVTDPDAGDTHTYTLQDDAGGRFVIDGVTGEITVAPGADLDHEAAGSHTVTVRATDTGGLHFDETLTITVSDLNETPDAIGFVGGSVAEGSAAGTSVATASVTDVDAGDTHTYTLEDDAGGRFVIDGVTGEITVAPGADLDVETAVSHTVTIRATDAGGRHVDETLAITVTGVNEAPDSIAFVGGTVAENATPGTAVATASTTDPDAGDTHTYSLQDDAGGRFVIDGVTGEITVAPGADLDHEAAGTHTVTVRSTDAGGLHVDETLTITVSDVNETPDSIGLVGGSVLENAAPGTSVGTASATDADAGDTHTYTLQDDAGGRFVIDGVTGEITVAPGADLDHEAAGSHTITVRATDAGGLHVDEVLTITVSDANETPDSIGFVGGSVVENAVPGTPVATASVTDVDAGDTHTYTLQDDAGGRFVIDGVTGEITVAPGADLDHEAAGSHTVTVRATDAGGLHVDETLTISVNDANETPDSIGFTGGTVVENAAPGTSVATAAVTDPDAGDTHTYTLEDDAGGRFVVDGVTGEITVAPGADLDHEAAGSHTITVRATDAGGLHVDETLTITISDVNEAPDSIGFVGGTVAENSAPGTSVANAAVTDPDAGDTHTYSLEDDAGGRFVIDGVTGEITVAPGADLDHEAAGSHTVTVRATDAGGLHVDETLTITVSDVNETPDSIGFVGGTVVENAASGTSVATAAVTDPDSGDTHTYTLEDDAGGRFIIDGVTGEITVAPGADLDHEAAGSHIVTVRATDAGGLHVDETLTITVSDANETPDSIGFVGGTVVENAASGTSVATAAVTDPDSGDTHTYTLEDDAGGRFIIDGVTGEITVAPGADLDHEATGSHTVTVRATDAGGFHVDETLTITVSDVNETPDSIGFVGGTVVENAGAGTSVATASVTDPDTGDTHTYSLEDNAGGRFVIDGVTGEITVAPGANLDHEAAGSHTVTVRATDAGGLHVDETLTITVSDMNETPNSIGFVGGTVAENAAAGTSVATAAVADPDAGDTHTYTLQDDAGGRFIIDGVTGEVTVAPGADLDHEAAGSHAITVRATDAGGLHVDETLTITVSDANETPDSIGFVGGTVVENSAPGTPVAIASVTDPDSGDIHTYSLEDDAGGRFVIDPATGHVTVAPGADLDFEDTDTHSVTVRATDSGGLHIEDTLTITVTNVIETQILPDDIDEYTITASSGPGGYTVTVTHSGGGGPVVYDDPERIQFNDVEVVVEFADSGLLAESVTEATLFIEGDAAFLIDPGTDSATVNYVSGTDSLSVTADGGTETLRIESVGSDPITIDQVDLRAGVGGLVSDADLGTVLMSGTASVPFIEVDGGSGSIALVEYNAGETVNTDPIEIRASVDELTAARFYSDVTITGDAGTIDIDSSVYDPATFLVNGNVTDFSIGNDLNGGLVQINGDAGTVSIADDVRDGGVLRIGGDATSIVVGHEMYDAGSLVEVGGHVGTLTTTSLLGGAALSLGSAGDIVLFTADTSSSVDVSGAVSTIDIAEDIAGGSSVTIGGSVTTITVGDDIQQGSTLRVDGDVGTLTVVDELARPGRP